MVVIVSIDPATCSGFCIFEKHEDNTVRIVKCGAFVVDTTSEYQGDHMLNMREELERVMSFAPGPIEHVHIETFFFSKKFCQGSDLNLILRAAIYQLLRETGIPYTLHGPTHWKKFIVGHVRPTKQETERHGKTKAPKAIVVDALKNKYNIQMPVSTSLSSSGKSRRVQFKYDTSDAIGIGIYGILSADPSCNILPYSPPDQIEIQIAQLH